MVDSFVLLSEADFTEKMGGVIGGPHKELFVKKSDEGKTMIAVYNELGEAVGFFEDWSWLPEGAEGPE